MTGLVFAALVVGSVQVGGRGPHRPSFVLPDTIWAAPDLECNIYFDSSLDSVRPEIYAYEAQCAVGRCENGRWTWKPTKTDAGRSERLVLDAWSDLGLQASATVTVRVAKLPLDGSRKMTMALLADSLVGGRFQDWIMKDVRDAGWTNFTPVGSHSGPSVSEVCRPGEAAHDGYGGFSPLAFLERYQLTEDEVDSLNDAAEREQLKAMGELVSAKGPKMLRKSPLVRIVNGRKTVDVQAWFDRINGGTPPDFIGIQLGVNGTCQMRDADMEAGYCETRQVEPMRRLVRLLRACAPRAEIGIGISEIGASDQDAFGRNYGCKVSRVQARKNLFHLNRLWISLVREFNEAGDDHVFAVPHGPATDQSYGIPHETVPAFDGSEIMVSRAANAYHPTRESARQTGGAYAAWVLCRMGEKQERNDRE